MKNLLIGIAVGFGFSVAFFTLMANPRTSLAPPEISYSQFIADVDGGKIEEVTFQGSKIVGRFTIGAHVPDAGAALPASAGADRSSAGKEGHGHGPSGGG